ncbi:MAG: PspA/IM30 family protein [Xanthomonadaceae bacterium]|jgi:phage shock protein A|nr:PspA/IM30 family protein [Xanthomonadaceae bacterium]
MSESLTSRVGRLIAGSFNAVVDAVEDAAPEVVMEQAVREIDSAIADVRADLGKIEAQRHLTAKRLAEDSARQEQLGDQARLAIAQNREDLASAAVERQIDIEAQMPVLESRLADLAEEKSRLEGYIAALQAKKREMREALAEFRKVQAAQKPAGDGSGAAARAGADAQTRAERAGDAFDRVFQRQTGLSGTSGTPAGSAAQLAELEELSRRNRVAERLAQLKADKA